MFLKYSIILCLILHLSLAQFDRVCRYNNTDDYEGESEENTSEEGDEDIDDVLEDNIDDLTNRLEDLERTDKENFNKILSNKCKSIEEFQKIAKPAIISQIGKLVETDDIEKAIEIMPAISPVDYADVVKELLKPDTDSFKKIIKFADTIRDDMKSKKIYEELVNQSIKNNYKNLDDFKNIVVIINKQKNVYSEGWSLIKHKILNYVVQNTISNIVQTFTIAYSNIHMVSLYMLSPAAGLTVMSGVVEVLCVPKTLPKLIQFVHGHTVVPLRVTGYEAILNTTTKNRNYGDNTLFHLGTLIRMTTDRNIDTVTKAQLQNLKKRLPKSLAVASLSWHVCIQNAKTGNKLTVSNVNKDEEWRVLVACSSNADVRSKWRFEAMFNGMYVMLKNIFLNRNLRETRVVTRNGYKIGVSMTPMNSGDYWITEAAGDDIYIRARNTTRYLSELAGEMEISHMKNDYSKWTITKC